MTAVPKTVLLKQLAKEPFASCWLLQFESTKPIHFIARKTEVAVRSNHLGIPLRARGAFLVGVVLDTIDLNHHALVMRKKQQKIHPLANEVATIPQFFDRIRVVVQVDLWNQAVCGLNEVPET